MIPRLIAPTIEQALQFSPVIFLCGARQTGKSTLAQSIGANKAMQYITLDDLTILQAAASDPAGFIASYDIPVIIDEVQRVPQLLIEIKRNVDANRKPGRFFLTGSANALMLPKISESLVGRMIIFTLYPFSFGEIRGIRHNIIDSLVNGTLKSIAYPQLPKNEIIASILSGGYPEIQKLSSSEQKRMWFQSYVSTILQRDIRDLSKIEGIHEISQIFSFLAYQAGSLLNLSNLSRELGIPLMTLKRYVGLIETIFLIHRLPAWFANIGKRLIKSPKIFFNDSGLLAFLLGASKETFANNPKIAGQLFENFIFQELIKQISWSKAQPKLYYFRTASGKEVDFILETADSGIIGIKAKFKETITTRDFDGLRELARLTSRRFKAGYVLSLGNNVVPFGNNLFTLPLSAFLGVLE